MSEPWTEAELAVLDQDIEDRYAEPHEIRAAARGLLTEVNRLRSVEAKWIMQLAEADKELARLRSDEWLERAAEEIRLVSKSANIANILRKHRDAATSEGGNP